MFSLVGQFVAVAQCSGRKSQGFFPSRIFVLHWRTFAISWS